VAVDKFIASFNYTEKVSKVVIDLRHAWLWDSSAIAGIDKVVSKFRRNGIEVQVLSPEGESGDLHDKLALHDKGVEMGVGAH
jgi:sulfate permease, SulP family